MAPFSRLFVLILGACLGGCAIGPDYHAPTAAMPDGYVAASTTDGKAPVVDAAAWWRSLADPELESLVDRALKANPDLAVALDRLQEARTEEVVVVGDALPEVDAAGTKAWGTGSDLTRGRVPGPLHAAEDGSGIGHVNEAFGFDAGWEIDLFGQYRREIEASRDTAEAAAEVRNDVLIAVIADVTRSYFDLRGLQMRLAVVQRSIATAHQTLDFVQARFERGITNELDVTLAKRELSSLQAEVAPLAARIDAARYGIAVLLGQYPESLAGELDKPAVIPPMPSAVVPGLPLDLLRRRPDIRAAERRLAAATASIGVAVGNLFPHVALTGGIGVQGPGTGVSAGTIWSAGPSAYWSVLDFGTLDGLVDLADLRAHEQLIRYKATILGAVRDVDSAISGYAAEQDRLGNVGQALAASQRAVSLASQRYDRGVTDFLNVLDAERQEYELEDQYALAEQSAADQLVALYKGLGGGWENYQAAPPIRQPMPAVVAAFQRLLDPGDTPR